MRRAPSGVPSALARTSKERRWRRSTKDEVDDQLNEIRGMYSATTRFQALLEAMKLANLGAA